MHFVCCDANLNVRSLRQRQCLGLLSRFGGSDRLRQFKLQDNNAAGDRVNKRDEIELAMQQVRTQDARAFSLNILPAVQICLIVIISYDSGNALMLILAWYRIPHFV